MPLMWLLNQPSVALHYLLADGLFFDAKLLGYAKTWVPD
jgi:hypothetical protein